MNLVPTASTTAALALGDALAMTLLVAKGFCEDDFVNLHPGGTIGKRLMRVEKLMHSGEQAPIVRTDTSMLDAVEEITRKKLGMTCVVDADGLLAGIITDGDLRRHLPSPNLMQRTAGEIMTPNPVTLRPRTLAVEALNVLEQRKITAIIVVDEGNRVLGVVQLHDLWRTEMF